LIENTSNSYWLWIEPFVHIFIKRNNAMLYNSLSGKKLEFDQPQLIRILKRMSKKENLLVVKLKKKEFERPLINRFAENIREHFMGDICDVNLSTGKPIQLKPMVNIHEDVRKVNKEPSKSGENIMAYLSEVTIYINNHSSRNSEVYAEFSRSLYKQFLFPHVDLEGSARDLPFKSIVKILKELKESGLYIVNIIGGNIFEYLKFGELLKYSDEFTWIKKYHSHYLDAFDSIDRLRLIDDEGSRINLLATFPLIEDKFTAAARFAASKKNVAFTFAIADESEVETCESIPARLNLKNVSLKPCYNGKNIDFFKDMVFIDREIILEANPSQKEIITRMAVNTNNFGKLTIMSTGDIYANVNAAKIGNINRESIRDAIYRELYHGKSWLKIRPNVPPCKGCLYNLLCPSLSNYEYVLGRNNLCHVYQ
jgi:pseudo-rSAM protein